MSVARINQMGGSIADYRQVDADPSSKLSPHSSIVGDVSIGARTSVFAGVHMRGDVAPISIGDEVNVQEGCLLHTSAGSPLTVKGHATIGHGAILHGCTIGKNVLVGMGSIVMDDAVIGDNCLIGAGSLVTGGKRFEAGTLIMGSPAKAVRALTDGEIDALITQSGDSYVEVSDRMASQGLLVHPDACTSVWPPASC